MPGKCVPSGHCNPGMGLRGLSSSTRSVEGTLRGWAAPLERFNYLVKCSGCPELVLAMLLL